ncbi:hypothetical protein ACQPZJ_18950 [Actinoplanes sp. CA-054009]
MSALTSLNGRWWDWQVDQWDTSVLRLIADNDLTYHHSAEVTFTEVVWASCADLFHHPVFRAPTEAEQTFARQVVNGDGYQVFAWDAETAVAKVPMMIVAQSVRVVEGIVLH